MSAKNPLSRAVIECPDGQCMIHVAGAICLRKHIQFVNMPQLVLVGVYIGEELITQKMVVIEPEPTQAIPVADDEDVSAACFLQCPLCQPQMTAITPIQQPDDLDIYELDEPQLRFRSLYEGVPAKLDPKRAATLDRSLAAQRRRERMSGDFKPLLDPPEPTGFTPLLPERETTGFRSFAEQSKHGEFSPAQPANRDELPDDVMMGIAFPTVDGPGVESVTPFAVWLELRN